jgi:hypothetical protein
MRIIATVSLAVVGGTFVLGVAFPEATHQHLLLFFFLDGGKQHRPANFTDRRKVGLA